MAKRIKGPISEEKEEPIISRKGSGKALSDSAFKAPFIAWEEKPAVPVSVRITPSLDRLINELVLHPRLPYADKSDFLRDAIFKFALGLARYLKAQGFNIGKMLPFLSKLEALQIEAERHLALKRTVDTMSDVNESIGLYIQENAWDDLLNTLEEYARILNEMPNGFYTQLAILKFFSQSNVAEAMRAFRVKKVKFPPSIQIEERQSRELRR